MRTMNYIDAILRAVGLSAACVGAAILLMPSEYQAVAGIVLAYDTSLFDKLRAPAGLMLAVGALLLTSGRFWRLAMVPTAVMTGLFLAYGIAGLVVLAVTGFVFSWGCVTTILDIVLGVFGMVVLLRRFRRNGDRPDSYPTSAPKPAAIPSTQLTH